MQNNLKKIILTGLMTALVFVLTFVIKIPVPYTSGYIHLGDSMIYLSVIVLGPFFGAFASGVGSMLADLLGGYAQYVIPTLIVKSLMALCMGLILKAATKKSTITAIGTSLGIWVVFSAGAIINLQNNIRSLGAGKLLEGILAPDADPAAVQEAQTKLNALPFKIILGIAAALFIMAIAAGLVSKKSGHNIFTVKAVIGMMAGGMIMVMGYFLTESFMYGSVAATFSVPMNLVQFFAGVTAATILAPAINRAASLMEK